MDLLRLENDFQPKDECSGETETGDRVFMKAQRSDFPCYVASRQVWRSMRSGRGSTVKGSLFSNPAQAFC